MNDEFVTFVNHASVIFSHKDIRLNKKYLEELKVIKDFKPNILLG